jgi:membrane protease YdiL (CAAX protease family)
MEALYALLQALLIILFAGGLALLAQWGRNNRSAEISLIVIVLFVSFLVCALGAIVALVGLSGLVSASELPPVLSFGSATIILFAGLAGFALCVPPLQKVTGRRHANAEYAAPKYGSEGFDTERRPSMDRLSGGWWSDPPIFFALWMYTLILAYGTINLLGFALAPDEMGSALTSAGRLSPVIFLLGELPLAVVAILGVGFGVRRDFRESLGRLGYGPVALPQFGLVALFVVGSLLLYFVFSWLFLALQPDLAEHVTEVSESIFSPQGLGPVGLVLFALLIGVGAAFGEETLFRGAIQPTLGITLTSILFASIHIQYGPSILLIYIFVISVGLGFLRKRYNTTTTFLAHAGYNFSSTLLAYFIGGP